MRVRSGRCIAICTPKRFLLQFLPGMLLGGGRDVFVQGNSFQNCRIGINYDNRGMNWQADSE